MAQVNAGSWRGKRALLPGHTGFKGAWLAIWLRQLGADVVGVSLPPTVGSNLFELADVARLCDSRFHDVRDASGLTALVTETRPQIVLHLAAQALVRASYRDPLGTYATNVMGTANLLEALRTTPDTRVAVMVTTDKVYRNIEQGVPFRESDPLGGHDPYSASKAAAEIVIASYRDAFLREGKTAVGSARAGNVIGGGDWSEDRILPDAVRAWQMEQTLCVRRPSATRPWQHVLEPLAGYLLLAEALWEDSTLAGAFNFGPATNEAATVRSVVGMARDAYGSGEILWGDGTDGPHEAGFLSLDIAKAKASLGFEPQWTTAQAVSKTMAWYRAQHNGAAALDLCRTEIAAYEAHV